MSNSYEMAHEWAKTRNPKATAVLVFEFQDSTIFKRDEGEEFLDDGKGWKKLVKFFRGGREGYNKRERLAFEELKFVFGPMAGDGLTVNASNCLLNSNLIFRCLAPIGLQRQRDL